MEKIDYSKEIEEKEIKDVVYTAGFVKNIDELKEKYPQDEKYTNSFYHHITYDFLPVFNDDGDKITTKGEKIIEIGKEKEIKIIGRIKTDKVDALLIEDTNSSNEFPHITLSTADGVAPYESNTEIAKAIENGEVEKIEDTLIIVEGYSDGKNDIINADAE